VQLSAIVWFILLAVLVLLTIFQKSDPIALAKLTNYEFKLLAKFELNPAELIPSFCRRSLRMIAFRHRS